MRALKKLVALSVVALVLNVPTRADMAPVDWPFITLDKVANISGTITDITHAGDGSGRLFVAEKGGHIFIVRDGALLPEPFLDVTGLIRASDELGLIGIAFAPDFKTSGEFYINYNRKSDGAATISRFKISPDPDVADPRSETILLSSDPSPGCIPRVRLPLARTITFTSPLGMRSAVR
jgi:hypothetical protein